MIIDFHVHPFFHEKELLNQMEKAGIDKAILLAVDVDPSDVDKPEIKNRLRNRHLESLFGIGISTFRARSIDEEIKRFFQELITYYPELKSSNQEIADIVKRFPEKFIGFGSVNPNKDDEYIETKLTEIKNLGLKGIKLLPTLQLFSPIENKNFEKICEYCEKNRLILLYHTGCDPGPWENPRLSEDANPIHLRSTLESYQPIIVLAHAGSYSAYKPGIWFEEAFDLAKNFENVYFDCAAVSSFIYSKKILKRIREEVGLERLLYGSDYPVVWGSDMVYEVNFIKRCQYLSEEEKEKILGLNAMRLLNL